MSPHPVMGLPGEMTSNNEWMAESFSASEVKEVGDA